MTKIVTATLLQIRFVVTAVGASVGGISLAAIVCGLGSILNGPSISTVATNGPFMFLGSRHESRQVPPQPYAKVKVRSYELFSLLMRIFGAGGRSPLQVN